MILYYRDPTVQVTSESIRVDEHVVRVADIAYVWHERGRRTARIHSRRLGRGLLVLLLSLPPLLALLCVVGLGYAAWDRNQWGLAATVIVVFVVGCAVLLPFLEVPLSWLDRSYDRGDNQHELWIHCHGQPEGVRLLSSSDGQRFGQIYRAVQRAVEQPEQRV